MTDFTKPADCNCAECPLKHRPFCPQQFPVGLAKFALLGESPARMECLQGIPFYGPAGHLLDATLAKSRLRRSEAIVGNAVGCWPFKGMSDSDWRKALKCCQPERERFLLHAQGFPLMAIGANALYALCGKESITAWYGYPLVAFAGNAFMPNVHPAFCLRSPGWIAEFERTTQRFSDMVEGTWKPFEPPVIHTPQNDEEIAYRLNALDSELLCVDSETGGTDAQFSPLLALGIFDGREAVSFAWSDVGSYARPALHNLLVRARRITFHNAQHDVLVLSAQGFQIPWEKVVDTLHMHAALYPLLAHKLSVAAARFNAPRWKSAFHDESEAKGLAVFTTAKMPALLAYNALDVVHGQRLAVALDSELRNNSSAAATHFDMHARAEIALQMRRVGILVDETERRARVEAFTARREAAARRIALGVAFGKWPAIDLGESATTNAIRKTFFEHFKCVTPARTPQGKPAMGQWTLQRWSAGFGAEGWARVLARLILRFRRSGHMVRMVTSLKCSPDGRVHPPWNPWGALTDRWSCGKPNLMNMPKRGRNNIRTLLVPDPGCTFVGADMDKAELRVEAILANDQPLLTAFAAGTDVHLQNSRDLFGEALAKPLRDLAKREVYGFNYGASPITVHENLTPEFPALKLEQVAAAHRRWFQAHPAIKNLQARLLAEALTTGRLRAPIGPRVWEFPGRIVDPNECYNRPVQATIAFIVNRAMMKLFKEGWDIRINCHDEIVLNVPDAQLVAGCTALKSAMEAPVKLNGKEWILPIDAVKVGKSWGNMKAPKEPKK